MTIHNVKDLNLKKFKGVRTWKKEGDNEKKNNLTEKTSGWVHFCDNVNESFSVDEIFHENLSNDEAYSKSNSTKPFCHLNH